MWGSRVLEVAVGLSFVFALLSMISSWLQEQVAAAFEMRARTLEEGIRGLLGSEEARRALYAHPLIAGLRARGVETSGEATPRPSYIPAWMFAEALFDIVAPPQGRSETLKRAIATGELAASNLELPPRVLEQLRARVERGERDLGRARRKTERWFDDAMDRASGWYKRRIRWFVLAIAAVLVLALNIDALAITTQLWNDAAVSAQVAEAAAAGTETPPAGGREASAQLQALPIPIGWIDTEGHVLPMPRGLGWLSRILGWLASIIAISLGAPFWFDALNRIVKLRLSGASPVPSQEQPARLDLAPEPAPVPRPSPEEVASRLPAIAQPAPPPGPAPTAAPAPPPPEPKPPS